MSNATTAAIYGTRAVQWATVALAIGLATLTLGSAATLATVYGVLALVALALVGVLELLVVQPVGGWSG